MKTIPPIHSPFNFEKKNCGWVLIKPVVFSEIADIVKKRPNFGFVASLKPEIGPDSKKPFLWTPKARFNLKTRGPL